MGTMGHRRISAECPESSPTMCAFIMDHLDGGCVVAVIVCGRGRHFGGGENCVSRPTAILTKERGNARKNISSHREQNTRGIAQMKSSRRNGSFPFRSAAFVIPRLANKIRGRDSLVWYSRCGRAKDSDIFRMSLRFDPRFREIAIWIFRLHHHVQCVCAWVWIRVCTKVNRERSRRLRRPCTRRPLPHSRYTRKGLNERNERSFPVTSSFTLKAAAPGQNEQRRETFNVLYRVYMTRRAFLPSGKVTS